MRTVLLIVLLSCAGAACAQRAKYVRYNRLLARAKQAERLGDHRAAIPIYDSAFALIPWVATDQVPAVMNALAAGRSDRANALLLRAVENGLDVERHYSVRLLEFLASDTAKPFLDEWGYMQQRFLDHADTATIRELQAIGTGRYMVRDTAGEGVVHTDSLALERLMGLIDRVGFPAPMTVGPAGEHVPYLLADQALDYPGSPHWQRLLPAIRKAIERGALEPEYLCLFQDIADHDAGRPMTYGVALHRYLDEPRILLAPHAEMDHARAELGLGPIDAAIDDTHTYPAKFVFAEASDAR